MLLLHMFGASTSEDGHSTMLREVAAQVSLHVQTEGDQCQMPLQTPAPFEGQAPQKTSGTRLLGTVLRTHTYFIHLGSAPHDFAGTPRTPSGTRASGGRAFEDSMMIPSITTSIAWCKVGTSLAHTLRLDCGSKLTAFERSSYLCRTQRPKASQTLPSRIGSM